jgi:hypothetical protein
MAKYKKYIPYVFVVLVGLLLLGFRACDSHYKQRAAELKGQYELLLTTADKEKADLTEHIAQMTDAIEMAQREIVLLIETRVEQERVVAVQSAEIERLRAEEPIQPELEVEPLVINLRGQIARMSLVIQNQEQIIQGNDKIIFNLVHKYEAQVLISDDYKTMFESQLELHALAIDRLRIAENRIRGLRFGSTIKTVGVLAGVGTIAYLLLRGN